MDEATADVWRVEPRCSKVIFEIEDVGHGVVKLTVVHDGFESGSALFSKASQKAGRPFFPVSKASLKSTGAAQLIGSSPGDPLLGSSRTPRSDTPC